MRDYDSNLSRRELLRRLAAAGIVTTVPSSVLTACTKGGQPLAAKELNVWGTATLEVADWAPFEKMSGVRVQFEDNGNDPGPVITRLITNNESQTRHVSGMQGGAERELAAAGAIVPWDETLIPSFASVWEWARGIDYIRKDGDLYGIPTVVNADSMIYRKDRVGKVDSYAAIFDKRFKGRVSMEDAWINSVIFTAIYLKESGKASIKNPGDLTETELREVMRFLSEHARAGQFRKLWQGWTDGVRLITSGEVWVMTGWEPIVYEARRQKVAVEYAVPKEGYEGWSNDLMLHPGAKKSGLLEVAHKFVEWELSGYYGAQLAQARGYVVPIDSTVTYAERHPQVFEPVKIRDTVAGVKSKFFQMKGQVYWQNVRPKNYRLYDEEWTKFRALF
jgi:putative spermidine/putrescine transport system substrate-binding protein